MKNILKLLTVLTLISPATISAVACNSSPEKGEEEANIDDLLAMAKDDIAIAFGKLTNDYQNLFNDNDVSDGTNTLTTISNAEPGNITDETIKSNFFINVINKTLLNVANTISSNKQLQPLWKKVNKNDILQLDDDTTTVTKLDFKWKKADNVDFGISDYDETKFNITAWNDLQFELQLNLVYTNEDNDIAVENISQDFNTYFFNHEANIDTVVKLASENIEDKIKEITYMTFIIDNITTLEENKSNLLTQIKNELATKIGAEDLKINTSVLTGDDFHNWKNNNKYEKLMTTHLEDNLSNKQTFAAALQDHINTYLDSFTSKVETWITTNKLTNVPNKDSIFICGIYQTLNWTFDDLTLKVFDIPYCVNDNISRGNNMANSLNVFSALFVGDNSLFRYQTNWKKWRQWIDILLNPNVYDNFYQNRNQKTLKEVYNFVGILINNYCTKMKINAHIQVATATNEDELNLKLSALKECTTSNFYGNTNWFLIINGIPFTFHDLNSGLEFSFTRADGDVWPQN